MKALDSSRETNAKDCAHCGQAIPRTRADAFCCSGCRAVWDLLHEHELDRYYELRQGAEQPVGQAPEPGRSDWLEQSLEEAERSAGALRVELRVQGLHCAACVWVLEQLWRRQVGALEIRINPVRGTASLRCAEDAAALRAWIDAVERMGYRVGPKSTGEESGAGDRGLLFRIGLCVALAMNVMVFSLGSYLGLAPEAELHGFFQKLSAALATLAVAIGGPVFFRPAFAGLRRGVLHLDLPISIGILFAWAGSMVEMLVLGRESYFDTLAVFVALMLVGRFLQERTLARNRRYTLENHGAEHFHVRRLSPETADSKAADSKTADSRTTDSGAAEPGGARMRVASVKIVEVRSGDELLVARGDVLPVRCRCDRDVRLSLDWIRGESEALRFEAGAELPAGAFLAEDEVRRVRSLEDFADSALLELLRSPNEDRDAAGVAAPARFGIERVYVILVFVAAVAAAGLWAFLDPGQIFSVVTAVLVVTCPCAIGLATPLAFDLALTQLRRRGIFVRSTSLLEKACRVRKIFFDKTGTLTWGDLRARCDRELDPSVRDLVYSMAASSAHPRSAAIARLLGAEGACFLADLSCREYVGSGVEARWHGQIYRLGHPSFVRGRDLGSSDDGRASVAFGPLGAQRACFEIEEDERPGIAEELAALRTEGFTTYLASGDREPRVAELARRLGFDASRVFAELSPEDKRALIERYDENDTLMLGDGINDGPALERAFCAGTPAVDRPVLPARCDFFYRGLGSGVTLTTLRLARVFRRLVRTNLALAAIYNVAVLSLAFAGVMTPLICAIVMPLSSIVLLSHTVLRLRRFGHESSAGFGTSLAKPSRMKPEDSTASARRIEVRPPAEARSWT